jgi:hypothetical protein
VDLRRVLAAMIVGATILFAIGAALERSSGDSHSQSVEQDHVEEPGSEPHEGEASETSDRGLTGSDEGTFLGIDPESVPVVISAIVVSLVLATVIWFRRTPGGVLIVAASSMLVFAVFDVREALHQFDESNQGIAVVALVVAFLHAGAAGIAGLLLTRPRLDTTS